MGNRTIRAINVLLLLAVIGTTAVSIYRWNQLRPRIVIGVFGPECSETLDSDAHYLAIICQAVIESTGSLPQDRADATHVIAENAAKLGFTWPNNFLINKAGQVTDCVGNPFDIRVLPDRVAVTSDALYGYYFAELKNPIVGGREQ